MNTKGIHDCFRDPVRRLWHFLNHRVALKELLEHQQHLSRSEYRKASTQLDSWRLCVLAVHFPVGKGESGERS